LWKVAKGSLSGPYHWGADPQGGDYRFGKKRINLLIGKYLEIRTTISA
jgi:hypothetical protein